MPTIHLTDQELQQLINVIANAPVPWVVSNPLLMKIGQQSQPTPQPGVGPQKGNAEAHADPDIVRGLPLNG